MSAVKSPMWSLWGLLSQVSAAAAQGVSDADARSLSAALQNINGMSSVFSLLPVLTGKTQNIKAVAARTFPGSLSVAGLGAGRVLSKLQIGIMLMSSNLYRNVVGELSYYHQEYVNTFSPPLIHIPTGTPERHSSNVIVNHNITEDYMVEAWFQTQGLPAKVELSQRNNRRTFYGLLVYLLLYAFETFINVQNTATGTALPLIILQIISGLGWIGAICVLQAARGQGKRFIYLNRLATAEYRCFQLVVSGKHVQSAVFSTQLCNIRDYNLFDSKYESKRLKAVGGAMVASGTIDVFATVLIVGLNAWAYGWLALQVLFIAVKVVFSLEPIRRIPIVNVQAMVGDATQTDPPSPAGNVASQSDRKTRLPIVVSSVPEFSFLEVCATQNIVLEVETQARWCSRTPGLFVGQPYHLQQSTLSAKPSEKSGEGVLSAPPARTMSISEKNPSYLEKAHTPSIASLTSPTTVETKHVSPTSSESGSSVLTITPSSASTERITEIPRIIVSSESQSSVFVSPISPVTPPGILLSRALSSRESIMSRAPTPPAKTPVRGASVPPPRGPRPANSTSASTPGSPTSGSNPNRPPLDNPLASRVPIIAPPRPKRELSSPQPPSPDPVRYLALKDGKLTLSETEPPKESNQALQREFLACLAEVVKANKMPSTEFLLAVETMREGIRNTMADNWYTFGTTDLLAYLHTGYLDILWRRLV